MKTGLRWWWRSWWKLLPYFEHRPFGRNNTCWLLVRVSCLHVFFGGDHDLPQRFAPAPGQARVGFTEEDPLTGLGFEARALGSSAVKTSTEIRFTKTAGSTGQSWEEFWREIEADVRKRRRRK